jgi:hypothetical protein
MAFKTKGIPEGLVIQSLIDFRGMAHINQTKKNLQSHEIIPYWFVVLLESLKNKNTF